MKMKDIDPLKLKVGDVIGSALDPDSREDSCHCAFFVTVSGTNAVATGETYIRVIAHDLRAGDIVREIIEREDEDDCHCNLYFMVERDDQYVTLTVVVRRDGTEGDPCDVMVNAHPDVLFVGHQDGVTNTALSLGAEPGDWV